eukprot:7391535-Prymnesium_polylepis.3
MAPERRTLNAPSMTPLQGPDASGSGIRHGSSAALSVTKCASEAILCFWLRSRSKRRQNASAHDATTSRCGGLEPAAHAVSITVPEGETLFLSRGCSSSRQLFFVLSRGCSSEEMFEPTALFIEPTAVPVHRAERESCSSEPRAVLREPRAVSSRAARARGHTRSDQVGEPLGHPHCPSTARAVHNLSSCPLRHETALF